MYPRETDDVAKSCFCFYIKDRNDQDSPIAALFQTMLVFDDKGVPHKVFL